jgi:hypothetical protein
VPKDYSPKCLEEQYDEIPGSDFRKASEERSKRCSAKR